MNAGWGWAAYQRCCTYGILYGRANVCNFSPYIIIVFEERRTRAYQKRETAKNEKIAKNEKRANEKSSHFFTEIFFASFLHPQPPLMRCTLTNEVLHAAYPFALQQDGQPVDLDLTKEYVATKSYSASTTHSLVLWWCSWVFEIIGNCSCLLIVIILFVDQT